MSNKPDTYEMLDSSPEKSSKAKFIILALAAAAILTVAAVYLWKSGSYVAGRTEQAKSVAADASAATDAKSGPTTAGASTQGAQPAAAQPGTQPGGASGLNGAGQNPNAQNSNVPSGRAPAAPASGGEERETVHFATDSARVLPSDVGRLESFSSKLKDGSGTISVEGHADSIGPDDYNQRLSARRAESVAGMLRKLGVKGGYKITNSGFGRTQPASDNNTAEGRAQNRRVVISFVRQ